MSKSFRICFFFLLSQAIIQKENIVVKIIVSVVSIYRRTTVFADPDAEEEEIATSLITIGICNGEMCLVLKPGGASISDKQFKSCLKLALDREKYICNLIASIFKEE